MNGHGFFNAFQIFNLNNDTIATAISQATLARYAMDHRESERKGSPRVAMRGSILRNRSHRLKPIEEVPLASSAFFPKSKDKLRFATVLQLNKNRNRKLDR